MMKGKKGQKAQTVLQVPYVQTAMMAQSSERLVFMRGRGGVREGLLDKGLDEETVIF